jgi:hypothetical protein
MSEGQSKTKTHKGTADAKAKYQPTAKETAALGKYLAHRKVQSPRLKVDNRPEGVSIDVDHPNNLFGDVVLMEALGTADADFYYGLLNQLSNGSLRGRQVDERTLNFMVAVIKGINPRDQMEAMLAAQMAAVHDAIMTFTRRLANVETIAQQDSAERALNKLARTFAGQMDALQRYRNGGEHKVMVQQVSVSDGGQAIVGNVTQAQPGRAHTEPETMPAEPEKAAPVVPFGPRPAVATIDPDRQRKPIPMEHPRKPEKAQSRK